MNTYYSVFQLGCPAKPLLVGPNLRNFEFSKQRQCRYCTLWTSDGELCGNMSKYCPKVIASHNLTAAVHFSTTMCSCMQEARGQSHSWAAVQAHVQHGVEQPTYHSYMNAHYT